MPATVTNMKGGSDQKLSSWNNGYNIGMYVLAMWLTMRLLTSLWAAAASMFSPLPGFEKSIAIWPPVQSTALWLERAFISPWQRWDALWYTRSVVNGIQAGDGTASFHPLYP